MLHQVSFNDYAWIMARQFERDRAAGIIHTYSIYESIGIAVQSAMFRRRFKNKDLAMALGITPSVASKKLRGDVAWSVQDLFAAAEMLQLDPRGLLPSRNAKNPDQIDLVGIPDLVAGTGFEPVASGL